MFSLFSFNRRYQKTTHTSYPDGKQMFEFHAKKQKEYHYPDGRKEIISDDNSRRMVHANGVIERVLSDGVRVKEYPNNNGRV